MAQKISAVVLTHNDEAVIGRCLASLSFANEIVVVDDNSFDKTVELARKAGASAVYQRALSGNFAAQRNFGITRAKHDWILFVDSDEEVPEDLAVQINSAVKDDDFAGYFLKRRDFLFGKWLEFGETAGIKLLRLARKGAGRFRRPVHEVWEVKGQTGILSGSLNHYPHPSVAEFVSEINYYSSLNAAYLSGNGVKTNCFEIILYPLGKFIQNYFFRGGYRDGVSGLLFSFLMSFHSFLTRGKLYLFNRQHA